MAGGDGEPRGLFEARPGEQHAVGEVPELRAGLHAEARLPDDRRDQLGGVTGRPQAGDGPGDVGGRFDRIQVIEQPQPLGREQGGQLGHLHSASLGDAEGRPDRPRWLAPRHPLPIPYHPPQTPSRPPQPSGSPPMPFEA